jgi:hypothetical protein
LRFDYHGGIFLKVRLAKCSEINDATLIKIYLVANDTRFPGGGEKLKKSALT